MINIGRTYSKKRTDLIYGHSINASIFRSIAEETSGRFFRMQNFVTMVTNGKKIIDIVVGLVFVDMMNRVSRVAANLTFPAGFFQTFQAPQFHKIMVWIIRYAAIPSRIIWTAHGNARPPCFLGQIGCPLNHSAHSIEHCA